MSDPVLTRPTESVYSTKGEKSMQSNYRNICKIARAATSQSQERFAEMIGVSYDAVRQYEAGIIMPSDEVVTSMIEVSGMRVLGYWHLLNKSRVASELLPEVERLSLPQAVIQLILRVQEFDRRHRSQDLMQIAQDGRIDPREREIYDQIVDDLEIIVQAAMQLKFAKPDE